MLAYVAFAVCMSQLGLHYASCDYLRPLLECLG